MDRWKEKDERSMKVSMKRENGIQKKEMEGIFGQIMRWEKGMETGQGERKKIHRRKQEKEKHHLRKCQKVEAVKQKECSK